VTPDLDRAAFAEHVPSTFLLRVSSEEAYPLELTRVVEHNYSPKTEQFSLFFRGPLSPIFSQMIHLLEHEKLGSLNLFLVPLGPENGSMRYECAFSRFRKDPPQPESQPKP
jgi:hypothetical protein